MSNYTISPWIMYLRKSRQDDPNETVEEVLSKHETQLQEYAQRELGGRIQDAHIFREIGSGESIDERVAIKQVLARMEDPAIKGVLCMEPSRLSRGDLSDCGRIIDSFRYTHTLVITPCMTYDLENKMERKFFKDELLRGNDYLEYMKEILFRGRVAAAKRGCYIGARPPYGYNKVKIGKDHTLEINEEEAEVVRMVFDLYAKEQLTPFRIASRLNEMGIPAPMGETWKKDTIRAMVRNKHYIGKVVFNRIKNTPALENGEIITRRLTQADADIIVSEGKHTPIIEKSVWEAAERLVARNPRVNHTYDLRNPLSGLLVCSKCGRAMYQHTYDRAVDRYECRTRPRCYKSTKAPEIINAVIATLEESELPAMERKVLDGDGDAVKVQRRMLEKLEKQMEEYRAQEDRQFELLETNPSYSMEVFERRNAALRAKMKECQENIAKTKKALPKSIDYAERVVALKAAIAVLKNDAATPAEQNKALKAIVQRIEFTGVESVHTDRKGKPKNINDFSITVLLRL